jgi:hypothetical protein
MQATVNSAIIGEWWETRPDANVILATGRVFDVLDVPAVAVQGTERMLFFVMTRGAPDDEDEWWSCGLDASPDPSMQAEAVRWHCRDSYVLAPPSRSGTGQDVRWVREPAGRPLPDGLRLLEYLVDACEEEG